MKNLAWIRFIFIPFTISKLSNIYQKQLVMIIFPLIFFSIPINYFIFYYVSIMENLGHFKYLLSPIWIFYLMELFI